MASGFWPRPVSEGSVVGLGEASQTDRGTLGRRAAPPLGRGGVLFAFGTVVALLGGLLWSVLGTSPLAARRLSVFGGSLVLSDVRPLSVIDVTTATVEVRLEGVDSLVGAPDYAAVQPVGVTGGTVLVNKLTGSFNFLGADDYVTDPHAPGVGLGPLSQATGAAGIAAGSDAYIIRSAPTSTVSLVGSQTVAAAAAVESKVATPNARVSPLGFATLSGRAVLSSSARAVQGADLWQLATSGGECRVYELLPGGSASEGIAVHLRATFHDQGCRGMSVESAANFVGVASPGWLVVLDPSPQPVIDVSGAGEPGFGAPTKAAPAFGAEPVVSGQAPRLIPTSFTNTATSTVAVTGAHGEVWFLAGDGSGWVLYGVSRSGALDGPKPLRSLRAGADPASPVLSAGYIYTMDRSQIGRPTLWMIGTSDAAMSPVAGTDGYPLYSGAEAKNTFTYAEVLGDGTRVVFNNPQNLEAVVVFTDGSRSPAEVDKADAVTVSAQGPAVLAATPSPAPSRPKPKAGQSSASSKHTTKPEVLNPVTTTTVPAPRPAPLPLPVVNPLSAKVVCATTFQQPHVPEITGVSPSSQAVVVSWSYQLLQETDCEPQTWSVQVKALGGSPQPDPSQQRVTGEQRYLFSGLRPATSYLVSVTAYINTLSTQSNSVEFTTPARGPDAPVQVSTTSDSSGDWIVSWVPCTEADNPICVVPASDWTVIASACGGTVVSSPPSVDVPGTVDSVTIPGRQLGLLGDAFSFSVQGSLASGLAGMSTSDASCTRSWATPVASDITLGSAGSIVGSTLTAQLQVNVTGDPTAALGTSSGQAEFVYEVGGDTVGPTIATVASVPGLSPGQTYVATVTEYPQGHPGSSVTISGTPFQVNVPWPSDLVSGTVVQATVNSNPNQGQLSVNFPADLPKGPLDATAVVLSCSNTSINEPSTALSQGRVQFDVDLVDLGGRCTISFDLQDTATPDPFGVASPMLSAAFAIGAQPTYSFAVTLAAGCLSAGSCGPSTGSAWRLVVASNGTVPSAGGDWLISTSSSGSSSGGPTPSGVSPRAVTPPSPANDPCATSQGLQTPTFPVTITLPSTCESVKGVTAIVSYRYLGRQVQVDAGSPTNLPAQGPPSTTTTTTSTSTSTGTTTSTSSPTSTTTSTSSPTSTTTSTTIKPSASPTSSGGSTPALASPASVLWRPHMIEDQLEEP